jgi:isoquinoline 1-oxidoreductase alpha subunit
MPAYKLDVNGTSRDVTADADTPLLWVLRDALGLTGVKFGCGEGLCGACTVHFDGDPARACMTTVAEAARAKTKITTIEGLSGPAATALHKAWEAEQVTQCGWCQPGQIMSAVVLIAGNSDPSDAEINAAMDGNICRCGTYVRIRRAIRAAAKVVQR